MTILDEIIQKAILANEVSPAQSFTFGFDQKAPDRNYLFHNSFNDPKEMTFFDNSFPKNEELSDEEILNNPRLQKLYGKYINYKPSASSQNPWRKDYGVYPNNDEQEYAMNQKKLLQTINVLRKYGFDPIDAAENGIDLINNNLSEVLENGVAKYNPMITGFPDGIAGDDTFSRLQTTMNAGYSLPKALNSSDGPKGEALRIIQMVHQKNPNRAGNLSQDELEKYNKVKGAVNFGTDIALDVGDNYLNYMTFGQGRKAINRGLTVGFSALTGLSPYYVNQQLSNTKSQYPNALPVIVDDYDFNTPDKVNKYIKDALIGYGFDLFTDRLVPELFLNNDQLNQFYNSERQSEAETNRNHAQDIIKHGKILFQNRSRLPRFPRVF